MKIRVKQTEALTLIITRELEVDVEEPENAEYEAQFPELETYHESSENLSVVIVRGGRVVRVDEDDTVWELEFFDENGNEI